MTSLRTKPVQRHRRPKTNEREREGGGEERGRNREREREREREERKGESEKLRIAAAVLRLRVLKSESKQQSLLLAQPFERATTHIRSTTTLVLLPHRLLPSTYQVDRFSTHPCADQRSHCSPLSFQLIDENSITVNPLFKGPVTNGFPTRHHRRLSCPSTPPSQRPWLTLRGPTGMQPAERGRGRRGGRRCQQRSFPPLPCLVPQ